MGLTIKVSRDILQIAYHTLAVVGLISLKFLFNDNMGLINEVDVLPLAKQFADPNWIPNDWYLNQPPGYRFLFATLFGNMAVVWGFWATSIIGRLLCYTLVALGLVLIGRCLGLKLPLLLTAVGLFLYINRHQGLVAQEWLVRSLESKAVAYGLLLLAIFCLLRQRYRPMALLLGAATSFHVLVGGWTTLIVLGTLLLRRHKIWSFSEFLILSLIYLISSAFAIPPVIDHLLSQPISGEPSSSFIYVFFRLSHHLNPLSWPAFWWLVPILYLVVLGFSMILLRKHQSAQPVEQYQSRIELFQLTLVSLIPFILGLVIAPFDQQGSWLQFYPFRVADVILPLNTGLLLACAVQQFFLTQQRVVQWVCLGLIAVTCSIQLVMSQSQFANLGRFPTLDAEFIALTNWVKTQTPADAVIVSPPVEFPEFSWLTERATVAKYKLLPQSKGRILEWYERLVDLNGGAFPPTLMSRTQDNRSATRRSLTDSYNRLTTNQSRDLMTKYSARYFMTRTDHQLELPIAYQNERYVLYSLEN